MCACCVYAAQGQLDLPRDTIFTGQAHALSRGSLVFRASSLAYQGALFDAWEQRVQSWLAPPGVTSFFCRNELRLERRSALAPRFRLGSVNYTEWMEGKKEIYDRYRK